MACDTCVLARELWDYGKTRPPTHLYVPLSMAILKRLSLLADPIAIDASFPTALPSWLQGGAFILPWLFVSWGLPSSSNPVPPTFPARKSELPFPVHSLTLKEKYNDVSGSPTVAVPFLSITLQPVECFCKNFWLKKARLSCQKAPPPPLFTHPQNPFPAPSR